MNTIDLAKQRVAIYARYSSNNQRETSIEDQVHRCREFIERSGGRVDPALIFADHAVSGASLQRPAFEKLMGMVTAPRREVDAIVTEDLSRVTRDFADAAMMFKKLQYLGVPLLGVADGIDTSARGAKMNFTLKSLLADLYLDELRDKTRRGLEGRARRGLSTGGLPYGYASQPETDAKGVVSGRRIVIDEDQARVVRRIFDDYLAGASLASIAASLNGEGVLPARAHTAHRRKGWVAGTVRAMLRNTAYVGRWSFGRREWVKVPGTNQRRPRLRPEDEVLYDQRDHLRIVPPETWEQVQARLAEVRAHYAPASKGGSSPRSSPGRGTNYLFSGILFCDRCGAPMVIAGGSSARYYRCADNSKRRTCTNNISVRESIARERLLSALRRRLASPEGLAYARQRLVERLALAQSSKSAEVEERHARLARTEARIQRLVSFIADGDHSDAVVKMLRDLEAQARDERNAIAALESQSTSPVRLPSPEDVLRKVFALEERLTQDIVRGREALRRYFQHGQIRLRPEGRHLVAHAEIFPLIPFAPETATPPLGVPEGACYGSSCGGRI